MTHHGPTPDEESGDRHRAQHRVRIPGFNSETEIGLGDVVKRVTSFAGIQPCAPCQERAVRLNQWLAFSRYHDVT